MRFEIGKRTRTRLVGHSWQYFTRQDFCCFIMAAYFGEIIEPSTRAIFDDYSDDEETAYKPELQLSWINGDEKLPPVLDVIFVFHGRLSLAFAEAYLLDENESHVAEINSIEKNSEKEEVDHTFKNLPSRIYIDSNKAICFVSPTCSAELGYEFTETLLPLLKISKKVIVFTNESLYNYKALSLSELPPAFIRELKTSYNLSQVVATKLPTPNFISGIPAGVISWCQIFKKDGSAFVCYSDQEKLDSITANPYTSIIRNLGLNVIKNENPNLFKKSFYGKPEIICGSSNIYI